MFDPRLPQQGIAPRACVKCGGGSLRWHYTTARLFERRFQFGASFRWVVALVCDNCGFAETYATRDRSVLPPRM